MNGKEDILKQLDTIKDLVKSIEQTIKSDTSDCDDVFQYKPTDGWQS